MRLYLVIIAAAILLLAGIEGLRFAHERSKVTVEDMILETAFRYEVCTTFNGQSRCATASGRDPEKAKESAKEIGCVLLTENREEYKTCVFKTAPYSVTAK